MRWRHLGLRRRLIFDRARFGCTGRCAWASGGARAAHSALGRLALCRRGLNRRRVVDDRGGRSDRLARASAWLFWFGGGRRRSQIDRRIFHVLCEPRARTRDDENAFMKTSADRVNGHDVAAGVRPIEVDGPND